MTAPARRIAWAPEWANAWGEDEYGLFADIEYKGVVQRMRWIPPGRFWMGSPEDEPERSGELELLHQVELPQGYWLADTACTQELWLAVIGKNPSRFQTQEAGAASRPVEQVSWHDCQEFLRRLNEDVPALDLRLSTEAEWEYACRAGTRTPFSFGKNITSAQVNYKGDRPYDGGRMGEYRGKTVPVKSLPANPWGLFEMHGNVWEWCLDEFMPCRSGFDIAPVGIADGHERRVVRGGSWDYGARDVRSAYRYGFQPSLRFDSLGFRFARGSPIPRG